MVFRYCLGMIISVSILTIGRGAATPVRLVNFSIGLGTSLLQASSREAGFWSRPNRTDAYGWCSVLLLKGIRLVDCPDKPGNDGGKLLFLRHHPTRSGGPCLAAMHSGRAGRAISPPGSPAR